MSGCPEGSYRESHALPTRLRLCILLILSVLAFWASPGWAISRIWIAGDGNWSEAAKWTPLGVPQPGDAAIIGQVFTDPDAIVSLDLNDTVTTFTLLNTHIFQTDGFQMLVSGTTTVNGLPPGSGLGSSLLAIHPAVGFATEFATDDMNISNYGQVRVELGAVLQVGGTLSIGELGEFGLNGSGTVNLLGNGSDVLVNDGRINSSNLIFNQLGSGLIDLDGDFGNGRLSVLNSLTINGTALSDTFGGEILVNGEAALHMNFTNGWTADNNSDIILRPTSSTVPLRVTGGEMNIAGDLDVGFGGGLSVVSQADIQANVIFEPTASVTVDGGTVLRRVRLYMAGETEINGGSFAIRDGGELQFNGSTVVRGGNFTTIPATFDDSIVVFNGPTTWAGNATINGIAQQQGDATVSASSIITADAFDMDGSLGNTSWDINARLEVHATQIGNGSSTFNGTLDIGGSLLSSLTIDLVDNTPWTMAGSMNLSGNVAFQITRLSGSPVRITGDVTVLSRASINADSTLVNSSTLQLSSATTILRMNGITSVEPGTMITGNGTLENGVSGVMSLEAGLSTGQVGVTNRGSLLLGDIDGVVSVPSFENDAAATLFANVGKNPTGTDSSVLTVSSGMAILAGNLQPRVVQLSGTNVSLAPGDSFTVLTAVGGLNGMFADVLDSLQGGMTYEWSITHNPSNVEIELTSVVGLLGDYDYDGDVDGADFLKWQQSFGSTTDGMADGNLDGTVNDFDLKIWHNQYGQSLGPLSTATAVPEPGTLLLVLVASGVFLSRFDIFPF